MESFLNNTEREFLRKLQRKVKDKLKYIRITVLLLLDKGRTVAEIAEDLGIDDSSIYRYKHAYDSDGLDVYLETDYKGKWGLLSCLELSRLIKELCITLYTDSKQIIEYIRVNFNVSYSASGVKKLLHRIGYSYKLTTEVPCEANVEKQEHFLQEIFPKLVEEAKKGETVVYFMDGVHPTHNSRSTHAWIATGEEREQPTVSGRDRVNVNGALNAFNVTDIEIVESQSVNAQSTKELYTKLLIKHPDKKIKIISDNAKYYKNADLREWLSENPRMEQVFLPAYSPNLNLIERLWKFMRKKVINTGFYRTKEEFRRALLDFFEQIEIYKKELESLLTLKFKVINSQTKVA